MMTCSGSQPETIALMVPMVAKIAFTEVLHKPQQSCPESCLVVNHDKVVKSLGQAEPPMSQQPLELILE
jgi:hypothetical protein